MPPLELMDRPTEIIAWEYQGRDSYGEIKVSDDPLSLKVRWIPKRRELRDANDNIVVIDVSVIADRELPIGTIIWRGDLDDLPGTQEFPETNVYQIVVVNTANDIKGRNTRYELMASRYKNQFPLTM